MEKRKIRVAIAHSGKDSAGYALAEKTLAEQTITELFEPVLFEADGDNATENIIDAYKEGRIDAVVDLMDTTGDVQSLEAKDAQWEKAIGEDGKGVAMLLTENMRMALCKHGTAITTEKVAETAEAVHKSLRRDFRISSPRIAILHQSANTNNEDETVVTPAVKQLVGKSIQAYGPYNADGFFENGRHLEFDGVIETDAQQGTTRFKDIAIDDAVRYITGLPLVRTMPAYQYNGNDGSKEEAEMNVLRQAIYRVIDIVRNRAEYDRPLANPLKKLYKDRKDESEKTRFNIPKKANTTEA